MKKSIMLAGIVAIAALVIVSAFASRSNHENDQAALDKHRLHVEDSINRVVTYEIWQHNLVRDNPNSVLYAGTDSTRYFAEDGTFVTFRNDSLSSITVETSINELASETVKWLDAQEHFDYNVRTYTVPDEEDSTRQWVMWRFDIRNAETLPNYQPL